MAVVKETVLYKRLADLSVLLDHMSTRNDYKILIDIPSAPYIHLSPIENDLQLSIHAFCIKEKEKVESELAQLKGKPNEK